MVFGVHLDCHGLVDARHAPLEDADSLAEQRALRAARRQRLAEVDLGRLYRSSGFELLGELEDLLRLSSALRQVLQELLNVIGESRLLGRREDPDLTDARLH